MITQIKNIFSIGIKIYMCFTVLLFFLLINSAFSQSLSLTSPDGQYEAKLKSKVKDVHYQIKEIATGRLILTTNAEYSTPNDVKAGKFSPDSKKFAAAYHYGHAGNYTWIGIWDIEAGKFLYSERKSDWIRDISWVFKQTPSFISPDNKYKAIKIGTAKNSHYQVIQIITNKVVFTTYAQYTSTNDVKAMKFSPDSKKFAAAYHYGHAGNYTWIGIWDITNGKLINTTKKEGFITIIPDDIFQK